MNNTIGNRIKDFKIKASSCYCLRNNYEEFSDIIEKILFGKFNGAIINGKISIGKYINESEFLSMLDSYTDNLTVKYSVGSYGVSISFYNQKKRIVTVELKKFSNVEIIKEYDGIKHEHWNILFHGKGNNLDYKINLIFIN